MAKILYVTYTRPNYSLNSVYIEGLRRNGAEVLVFKLPSKRFRSHLAALKFIRENRKDSDFLMIGYDSSLLAFFLRPFYLKKMVFCSVLPVYERLIFSRGLAGRWSLKAIYYRMIDFLAFHAADLSMVESRSQIEYISKKYFVPKKKFFRAWIGVDDNNFFHDPSVPKLADFTVLFRGALMPEAGAEYVIQAAKILEKEKIKFVMLSGGLLENKIRKLVEELKPGNLEFRTELFSYDDLRKKMQECHLSLGQVSGHPRLDRTIPHKVYESMAMKLPYLTAANRGILELVKSNETCITCKPADAKSLADKILWAKNNRKELERISGNGYRLYGSELKPELLASRLLEKMGTL